MLIQLVLILVLVFSKIDSFDISEYHTMLDQCIEIGVVNEKKIIMGRVLMNFYQADRLCRVGGGSLMAIETELESDVITNYLQQNNPELEGFWISGTSWNEGGHQSKDFYWNKNGNPVDLTFSNWAPGKPDYYQEMPENCMEIRRPLNLTWNDVRCTNTYVAICEIPHPRLS